MPGARQPDRSGRRRWSDRIVASASTGLLNRNPRFRISPRRHFSWRAKDATRCTRAFPASRLCQTLHYVWSVTDPPPPALLLAHIRGHRLQESLHEWGAALHQIVAGHVVADDLRAHADVLDVDRRRVARNGGGELARLNADRHSGQAL